MIARQRILRSARLVAVNSFASQYWLPKRARLAVYRAAGLDVSAPDITVFSGTIIRTRRLSIGQGVFVNHGCFFGDAPITLEDHVFVGVGVVFASSDHEVGPTAQRAGADRFAPIEVGAGTWIGARAVILSGVRIAAGCIIGAGAVVTRDTEPNGVYVGVPARRVRELPEG